MQPASNNSAFFSPLAEALKIWLFCILAAICYGVLHDQITVRLCLEYFTIGHPPIFPTVNPTLLALGWGIIATWWVGAFLGVPTIVAVRFGKRPAWNVQRLFRPFSIYLGSVAIAAALFGCIGYILARTELLKLPQITAVTLPVSARDTFISAGWAHNTSYIGGAIGALILWRWIWRQRRGGQSTSPRPVWRVIGIICGIVLLALLWGGYLYLDYTFNQQFKDAYFPVKQ